MSARRTATPAASGTLAAAAPWPRWQLCTDPPRRPQRAEHQRQPVLGHRANSGWIASAIRWRGGAKGSIRRPPCWISTGKEVARPFEIGGPYFADALSDSRCPLDRDPMRSDRGLLVFHAVQRGLTTGDDLRARARRPSADMCGQHPDQLGTMVGCVIHDTARCVRTKTTRQRTHAMWRR